MPELPSNSFDADFTSELNAAFDSVVSAETASLEPESAPPEVAAPAAATPEAAPRSTPEAPASTPSAVNDDAIIEVMVNGQPQQMRLGDARKGFMMHAAFTQKTQELAKQREQVAQQQADAERAKDMAAQYQRQFYDILGNRDKLAAAYIAAQGGTPDGTAPQGQPQYAPIDPDALRQQLLSELAPQVQQQVLSGLAAEQTWQRNHSAVTTVAQDLINADPILSKIPNFENLVYEAVAQMGPKSTAEATEYIRLHIEGVTSALSAGRTEAAKAEAIAKAKAVTGTERGGSPIAPSKKEYADFNDPQMFADMMAALG